MATPSTVGGAVVLVEYPFSDLSRSKLRPAVVLANVAHNDLLLCQITSNPYADPIAVELAAENFSEGGLERVSYARPGKIFTASHTIVAKTVGQLDVTTRKRLTSEIVALLGADLT